MNEEPKIPIGRLVSSTYAETTYPTRSSVGYAGSSTEYFGRVEVWRAEDSPDLAHLAVQTLRTHLGWTYKSEVPEPSEFTGPNAAHLVIDGASHEAMEVRWHTTRVLAAKVSELWVVAVTVADNGVEPEVELSEGERTVSEGKKHFRSPQDLNEAP